MNRKTLGVLLCALAMLAGVAAAQQVDVGFGVSAVSGRSSTDPDVGFSPQMLGGGAFPVVSADLLLWKHFGFGGEVAWRAKQNLYQGYQPFRPILYDFNAVWAPPLGKHAALQFQGGIGAVSSRFYQGQYTCSFTSCTNYVSSNHLLGDVGAGLKLYVGHDFFVRPEASFYFVRNNFEYTGPHAQRYGVTIGYTLGPKPD